MKTNPHILLKGGSNSLLKRIKWYHIWSFSNLFDVKKSLGTKLISHEYFRNQNVCLLLNKLDGY